MLAMPRLLESPTRAEARRLVKNIAKDHGSIGEYDLNRMPNDLRRKVEEAMLKKDEMIGSFVTTY